MTLSRRTVVAAALASLPARAFAQATKVYRVGLVTIGALDTTVLSPAMAKEFAKLGDPRIEQRQLDSSLRRTGDFRLRPVERPSALLGLAIDVRR
jgi:ABC-type sugar transport system substrate-binding protein